MTSGKLGRDFIHRGAPELRDFEHVGLVDAGEFLAALLRELEGDAGYADHFIAGVTHGVPGFAGCRVPFARLAEVEPAKQLADEQNVGAFDDLRPQRAVDGEFFEREGGTQIGESAERGANLQQAGFGALVRGQGIEFVAAHRAQQHGVGGERGSERVGGQRRAVLHNRDAADALAIEIELCGRRGLRLPSGPRPLRW